MAGNKTAPLSDAPDACAKSDAGDERADWMRFLSRMRRGSRRRRGPPLPEMALALSNACVRRGPDELMRERVPNGSDARALRPGQKTKHDAPGVFLNGGKPARKVLRAMFFIRSDNQEERGPYSADEIWERIGGRQCTLFTMARRQHEAQWKMLGAFIEFARVKNLPKPKGGTSAPLHTRPPMSLREMVEQKRLREAALSATRAPAPDTPSSQQEAAPEKTPARPPESAAAPAVPVASAPSVANGGADSAGPPLMQAEPEAPPPEPPDLPAPPQATQPQPQETQPQAPPPLETQPQAMPPQEMRPQETQLQDQKTQPQETPPPATPVAPPAPPAPASAPDSSVDPPSAPAAPRARLDLPRPVKIIYGAGAAFWLIVMIAFAVRAQTPLPRALGQNAFALFVILGTPAAVSLGAWRVSRRSRKAASIALLVTLALTPLLPVGADLGSGPGLALAQRARTAFVGQGAGQGRRSRPEALHRPAASPPRGTVDESKINAAVERTSSRLKTAMDGYRASGREIVPRALALSSIQSKEHLAARRAEVSGLMEKRNALALTLDGIDALLREELGREGLSQDEISAAVAALAPGMVSQKTHFAGMMASNGRLLLSITELLGLLERQWGRWEYDAASNQFRFRDPAALDHFNRLVKAIRDGIAEQPQTQGWAPPKKNPGTR
jgi:hypothetical protein